MILFGVAGLLLHFIIMKFFIDTANLAQIKEAHDLGVLDGVTTNPSLMAKEGITDLSHYNVVPGATLYRDLYVD